MRISSCTIDFASFDIVKAAQRAQRRLEARGDDAPTSLDEAIANLETVTNRILEKQRAFEDAQRRLDQQLAAVAGDIEERWRALEQQLAVAVTSLCRHD